MAPVLTRATNRRGSPLRLRAMCFGAGSCGNAVPAASAEYVAPNRCAGMKVRVEVRSRPPVPEAASPICTPHAVPHSRVSGARGSWGRSDLSPMSEPPPPRCRRSQLQTADFLIRRRVSGSFEKRMATQKRAGRPPIPRRASDTRSGSSRATRSRLARSGPFACSASGCDSTEDTMRHSPEGFGRERAGKAQPAIRGKE